MLSVKPGLPTLLTRLCVTTASVTREDNGKRLAFALERESEALLAPAINELEFEFKPKISADRRY